MKKLICMAIILLCLLYISAFAQEEYIVEPTSEIVLVNGKEIDFTAYNVNGYNYFKLRDLAMALIDTDKAFNVSGSSDNIYIYTSEDVDSYTPYKPLGNELSPNAVSSKNAIKNPIKLVINNNSVLKPNFYNIEGFNYIKLRDFAFLLSFYVNWDESKNTIIIDTQKNYEVQISHPVLPQDVFESYTPVFINEMPINTFTIGNNNIGFPGIDYEISSKKYGAFLSLLETNYIIAEELINYGFDIYTDEKEKVIYLTQNADKKFGMMDGIIVNRKTSNEKIFDLNFSEYILKMDGENVQCYSIGDKTLISLDSLLKYGEINTMRKGISFDFLKNRLDKEFNSIDTTQLSKIELTRDRVKKLIIDLNDLSPYHFESSFSQISNDLLNGICKFSMIGDTNNTLQYNFIGYVENDYMNGEGYFIKNVVSNGIGGSFRSYDGYEIGHFQTGAFIDGVKYRGSFTGGSGTQFNAIRIEGAMFNGYKRECKYPENSDFHFGYIVVCEGEVQNGEYCGYYRRYDESGKLIFEGQYSDYINMIKN